MKAFHSSEDGFSLIEVLIALVILVIVILGGGLYFFYGRLGINREGYRRAALELASQRLEELKAAKYSEIIPDDFGPNYNPYYIVWRSSWDTLAELIEDPDDPNFSYDYVTVGNLSDGKMLTAAQYQDNDDPPDSYDYLKVTVTVSWGDNPDNKVELVTLIAP